MSYKQAYIVWCYGGVGDTKPRKKKQFVFGIIHAPHTEVLV